MLKQSRVDQVYLALNPTGLRKSIDGSSLMIDDRQFRWLLDGLSINLNGVHPDVKERIII